jgi:hypothetical protein
MNSFGGHRMVSHSNLRAITTHSWPDFGRYSRVLAILSARDGLKENLVSVK